MLVFCFGEDRVALSLLDKRWLLDHFQDRVQFDEPMSRHTSFKVGGPADAVVAPESILELASLVHYCRRNGLPYLVVGDGTNIIVRDQGIRGVVILLTIGFNGIDRVEEKDDEVIIRGMAGARTRSLCRYAIRQALKGVNFALGIPGTIGGAIAGNAGTTQGSMSEVVDAIEVFEPSGNVVRYLKENLCFSYRRLSWKTTELPIILAGYFKLRRTDATQLKKEASEIMKSRLAKQPAGSPCAGCFFKNPSSGVSAGELIDRAGLKGESVGGAQVSFKHANFIINTGSATAEDVLLLMERIEKNVFRIFGLHLEPEVKILGY